MESFTEEIEVSNDIQSQQVYLEMLLTKRGFTIGRQDKPNILRVFEPEKSWEVRVVEKDTSVVLIWKPMDVKQSTPTASIFFSDLKPEAQKRVLQTLDTTEEKKRWNVIPMFSIWK